MTTISHFGKQNSTLGSVVPLAMFSIDVFPKRDRQKLLGAIKVPVNIEYIYLIQFVHFDNSSQSLRHLAVKFLEVSR